MASTSGNMNEVSLWRSLIKNKVVLFGLTLISVLGFLAVFAPVLTPYDPNAIVINDRLIPPSLAHWMGTDELGRDIFTRLIYAGRISLSIGLGVAICASVIGIFLGLIGGFFRRLDGPISRLIDSMMAFPDILLAIALVATFGGSLINLILALSIVYTPRIARIVRASTLVVRELTYVEAAEALGVKTNRIMINHVLPNITSPIIVQATFIFGYAMLAEAGLSFLGVGVDSSTPTWGIMINSGRQYIDTASWLTIFPCIAITLCVMSLQLTGDGLRDALDPRIAKDM